MAVISLASQLTALEAAKRNGATADQRRIIEVLQQTNEFLLDMPVHEANDTTGENHLVRTALPHGTHRAYNEGVKPQASQTETKRDLTVQLTGYSEIDVKLIREQIDPRGFIQGEDNAFLAGMAEDMADDLVYGNNAVNPRLLNGLAVRRPVLKANQCVGMGGSGTGLTSVYLCKLGNDKVSLIYPKGAKGVGVNMKDMGEVTVEDEINGGKYQAHRSYFEVNYGLSVGDERALIRICNIDAVNETAASRTDADALAKMIVSMSKKLPKGEGKVVCYANSDVINMIDLYLVDKSNILYSPEDQYGKEVTKLRNITFRQIDAILNTESAVA